MRVSFSTLGRARVGKTILMGVLLSLVLTQLIWAGTSQTVVLTPAPAPELRIDFNYNFQNALPPFPKEPAFPGKEIARGLIPTVPPTPLLRNISDNELYLNVDHTRDFVNGKLATYRSTYNGHVIFTNLSVSSIRDGLELPYRLDLFTYEHYCAGWVHVRSGWAGELVIDDQKWQLVVVDNLNGEIGQNDTLHLMRMTPGKKSRTIIITPVPEALFIDGHAFNLGFTFKPGQTGPILEALFTETNMPTGNLNVAARGCSYVLLSDGRLTAVLDAGAGVSSLPAGTYKISDCLLDEIPAVLRHPVFIRCDRTISIEAGKTASLEIGPPLRNTVQVTRERNLLRLTYQLLGQAGEQYEYYNWKDRPRFSVWNGPVKIGSGALPFG